MNTAPIHTVKFETDREMAKFLADPTQLDKIKQEYPPPTFKAQVQFMTNSVLIYKV